MTTSENAFFKYFRDGLSDNMLKLTNDNLAVLGGDPIRQPRESKWPIYDATEIDAIRKFINQGEWWSPLVGTSVHRHHRSQASILQDDFSRLHGCQYGISCSSGTAALMLALRTIGIGPGDSVIVPDYTWMATAQAVIMVGADPIFCDIIPETLNIDPERVKDLLHPDVKAIIPVHMLGLPVEMDELKALGVPIIEDACLAHGASYKKRPVGALGQIGAFSFNSYKIIAGSEGGMLTTNNESYATRAEVLANNGQDYHDPWWQASCEGWNLRINQFAACICNAQLTRLAKFRDIREKQADKLREALVNISGIHIQPKYPDRKSAYYGLPLSYDRDIYRAGTERMGEIIRAEGIDIATNYGKPLTSQPAFEKYRTHDIPNAWHATEKTLFFPHASLLNDDTDAIVKCFEKIYAKRELL